MPNTGIHANTPKYLFYAFLLVALIVPASMALAAPPAGTLITNQASVSFHDNNSNTFTAQSNTVTVTVTSVYTVSVSTPADAASHARRRHMLRRTRGWAGRPPGSRPCWPAAP